MSVSFFSNSAASFSLVFNKLEVSFNLSPRSLIIFSSSSLLAFISSKCLVSSSSRAILSCLTFSVISDNFFFKSSISCICSKNLESFSLFSATDFSSSDILDLSFSISAFAESLSSVNLFMVAFCSLNTCIAFFNLPFSRSFSSVNSSTVIYLSLYIIFLFFYQSIYFN